jgi:pyruvate kinase
MDGTDAVMLSAETAIGVDPIAVISTMSDVCRGAEKYTLPKGRNAYRINDAFQSIDESIAMAVMYTANHLSVKAIIALTESGSTPLWMSRIRSDIPIYALTPHKESRRRVTLYRGVYPVLFSSIDNAVALSDGAIFSLMIMKKFVKKGDLVILTNGSMDGLSGGTNSMRILEVKI